MTHPITPLNYHSSISLSRCEREKQSKGAEQEKCKRGDTRREALRTFSWTNAMSDFSLRSAFVCGIVCQASREASREASRVCHGK